MVFSGCFSLCPFRVCPLEPSNQCLHASRRNTRKRRTGEAVGFNPAGLGSGGEQEVLVEARNSSRLICEDAALAERIFSRLLSAPNRAICPDPPIRASLSAPSPCPLNLVSPPRPEEGSK